MVLEWFKPVRTGRIPTCVAPPAHQGCSRPEHSAGPDADQTNEDGGVVDEVS